MAVYLLIRFTQAHKAALEVVDSIVEAPWFTRIFREVSDDLTISTISAYIVKTIDQPVYQCDGDTNLLIWILDLLRKNIRFVQE